MNRIITIGREFGSGGRELGRRLAEKLQIAYYDQEIITEISKRTELSEQYVQQVVEHHPISSFPIHIGRSFQYPAMNPVMQQQQSIYMEQSRMIRELAEKSDCVIVGRCADYILSALQPFRIFVYADMDSKIRRCMEKGEEQEPLTERELKKYIVNIDRNRAKYYNFYTNQKWGDKLNYDLCINTTGIQIKEIASVMEKIF